MRVQGSVASRHRKKKFFRLAKGYYSDKGNRWRAVIQQVEKSLRYAYRDRKDRKGMFRSIWITRLNAAAHQEGMSYSRFMSGLRKASVIIDRKMLADLAVNDTAAFKQLVEIAKETIVKA